MFNSVNRLILIISVKSKTYKVLQQRVINIFFAIIFYNDKIMVLKK